MLEITANHLKWLDIWFLNVTDQQAEQQKSSKLNIVMTSLLNIRCMRQPQGRDDVWRGSASPGPPTAAEV